MKYIEEIVILLSVDKVIELFDNLELRMQWQHGLVKSELIEGIKNEVGAKTRLVFKMNNRNMKIIETIKERDLPNFIVAIYEGSGTYNISKDSFQQNDDGTTTYRSEQEFIFKSLTMKLIGPFLSRMFKKETKINLIRFKEFCENYLEK